MLGMRRPLVCRKRSRKTPSIIPMTGRAAPNSAAGVTTISPNLRRYQKSSGQTKELAIIIASITNCSDEPSGRSNARVMTAASTRPLPKMTPWRPRSSWKRRVTNAIRSTSRGRACSVMVGGELQLPDAGADLVELLPVRLDRVLPFERQLRVGDRRLSLEGLLELDEAGLLELREVAREVPLGQAR